MKVPSLLSYYTIVCMLLLGQVVFTMYQSGTVVNSAERIHSLEAEKKQLLKEQLTLENQLSGATALALVLETAGAEYEAIQNPLIITTTKSVASTR